ncbi:MAG: hypothetical protein GX638_04820 [Crenarchaeota archaeon]|nr:hypothetical protein [Thermoproteota archaeon]
MMNNGVMITDNSYTIPFDQIDEDGSFNCPKCQTTISPDDETSETYEIIETKMVDDEISELTIECRCCGTVITLKGTEN